MKKKLLKGLVLAFLLIFIALVTAPFLFKDRIQALVIQTINEKIDATVAFSDIRISLLNNFPSATISIDNLSVLNKFPFDGDTLFYGGNVNLKLGLGELIKGDGKPLKVQSVGAKDLIINIISNENGQSNYEIATVDNQEQSDNDDPFSFELENYDFENIRFVYSDVPSHVFLRLDSLNHQGKGNFVDDVLDLETTTSTRMTITVDGVNYMNQFDLSLNAVLALDLTNNKFRFKQNELRINQLPLQFDGYIQLLEAGQFYDLNFDTPVSSFTNFLGLIPEVYAGNIEQVNTSGDFSVVGSLKGTLTDTTIPQFNIQLASDNASFQYPDLPKSVRNIVIQAHVINETGLSKDTYVDIEDFKFQIDKDIFEAKANIKNLTDNPAFTVDLSGMINLANLPQAYPFKFNKALRGTLKADVRSSFDMNSIEKEQYSNLRNEGQVSLSEFNYDGPEMDQPLEIGLAEVSFNTHSITLNQFSAKAGSSDLNVNGRIDNFYGFLFNNQDLKGNFSLTSDTFAIADFISTDTTEASDSGNSVKIPSFLDCRLSARASKVIYDNLLLTDVTGILLLKDQSATLKNLQMNLFDGQIGMNGLVSTKDDVSKFEMSLVLNALSIAESFSQLDLLKSIAPIAKTIEGQMNATIKLSGDLTQNMTPDLATISGDLTGQLVGSKITAEKSPLLSALGSNVKFLDLNKIDLNKVKMAMSFKDGKVDVQPFKLAVEDVGLEVRGSHSFDQSMDYNLRFEVPVKYLGQDVSNLMAKLSPSETNKVNNVSVIAKVTGSFLKPSVSSDLKEASANLANQLVQMQKDKLLHQGKDVLQGLLGGKKVPNDTTQGKKDPVKSVIKGILKKKNNNE